MKKGYFGLTTAVTDKWSVYQWIKIYYGGNSNEIFRKIRNCEEFS